MNIFFLNYNTDFPFLPFLPLSFPPFPPHLFLTDRLVDPEDIGVGVPAVRVGKRAIAEFIH